MKKPRIKVIGTGNLGATAAHRLPEGHRDNVKLPVSKLPADLGKA